MDRGSEAQSTLLEYYTRDYILYVETTLKFVRHNIGWIVRLIKSTLLLSKKIVKKKIKSSANFGVQSSFRIE